MVEGEAGAGGVFLGREGLCCVRRLAGGGLGGLFDVREGVAEPAAVVGRVARPVGTGLAWPSISPKCLPPFMQVVSFRRAPPDLPVPRPTMRSPQVETL